MIQDDESVTVFHCGNYKEVICCKHDIKNIEVTKLNKYQYVDNNTGEIKEYSTSKIKTLENFKREFKNIPRLIRGYFNGDYTERFITLTYSYKMDNPYQLPYDFKKFIKKVERKYCKCRYIYIKEPQDNGSWHIHSIIKRLDNLPFNISVEKVRSLWELGYEVSVEIPYNIETLYTYFDITRYKDKKLRIIYYPSYLNIYGCSKDMKIIKSKGKYQDEKPLNMQKIYQKENQYFSVNTEDGEIIAQWKTVYEQYKNV